MEAGITSGVIKNRTRRTAIAALVLLLSAFGANNASAINAFNYQFYSDADIMYYLPEGTIGCLAGGTMSGNSNFAKVASYFAGNNSKGVSVSTEAIAGIIANFKHESALNPFRNQGQYNKESGAMPSGGSGQAYGIAQFDPRSKIVPKLQSDPRTGAVFNQYYQRQYGGVPPQDTQIPEGVPDNVNNAWLEVQLDYIIDSEFTSTKLGSYRHIGGEMGLDYLADNLTILEAMNQAKTPTDAARVFIWIYERPADKPGGAKERGETAEEIFSDVKSLVGGGFARNGGNTPDTKSDGSNVTIIGDSITKGSMDEILQKLPEADINAEVGRQFTAGTEIAKNMDLRDVVVFALGTNDTGLTSAQIANLVSIVGSDRTLILTTNYGAEASGKDYTSNNNVINKAAQDYENITVADWYSAAGRDPAKYISGDGIHPTAEGQQLFADTVYNAILNSITEKVGNDCATPGFVSVDGYVFPLAGATKSNYLNPNGKAGESVLSRLPCGSANVCHHDYPAVDLGLNKKLADGSVYTSANFSGRKFSDMYYYSTGVKVLAIHDGRITRYGTYSNGTDTNYVSKCASVTYETTGASGNVIKEYWFGHMSYDSNRKAGDTFKAGDVIGEVGPPQCAQNTQAHLHINVSPQSANDRSIIDLMDKLYEALPES
jgi:murein DD-endopeptidase MepM/ murein hydrolase activator NlpD